MLDSLLCTTVFIGTKNSIKKSTLSASFVEYTMKGVDDFVILLDKYWIAEKVISVFFMFFKVKNRNHFFPNPIF